MKTKITSLTLLIPAIVLAQPAPQNQPNAPQSNAHLVFPAGSPAPAPANALSNAKKQAKELKGNLPSNGEVGSDSCSFTETGCIVYAGGGTSD